MRIVWRDGQSSRISLPEQYVHVLHHVQQMIRTTHILAIIERVSVHPSE